VPLVRRRLDAVDQPRLGQLVQAELHCATLQSTVALQPSRGRQLAAFRVQGQPKVHADFG
jgi:hypothetical protein